MEVCILVELLLGVGVDNGARPLEAGLDGLSTGDGVGAGGVEEVVVVEGKEECVVTGIRPVAVEGLGLAATEHLGCELIVVLRAVDKELEGGEGLVAAV